MSFNLRALWTRRASATIRKQTPFGRPVFRLGVEVFEDRVVPAAPVDLGPALAAPAAAAPATMIPIQITDVTNVNGVLTAVGTIGSANFTAPINLSTSPNAADPTCPILHLELGPINLDLLGLVVETSPICLEIDAHAGEGLLGDLLCGVSGLLDGGLPLGDILGGLTGGQLTDLLGGLTDLLNGVFGLATAPNANTGVSSSATGSTDILNLSLGPVDLNLLGLSVHLDDCDGGPVTIDITAESGPGRLLGNLLGGLAGALDGGNQSAIDRFLDRIADRIDKLVNR
jgi:hypothetical protein